ncbi:uncharacterized protein LOC129591649 [Paramacrobiotus metropolitanus]|uniref:uncharacterized protein LOC129591649 n=1 Tax=Paramacrobiotus metropolitanus TaxID=2943436 RepID=UPI0024464EA2|nr:uncharacterized protein LOC129591649 [Paramacrobiotus metropolitanus]
MFIWIWSCFCIISCIFGFRFGQQAFARLAEKSHKKSSNDVARSPFVQEVLFWEPYDSSGKTAWQEIRNCLRSATRSIKIATFILRGHCISDELQLAAARGVKVEIIIDGKQLDHRGCHPENLAKDSFIRTDGRNVIQCRIYRKTRHQDQRKFSDWGLQSGSHRTPRNNVSGIFHKKYVIIDESFVIFGSSNLTDDSLRSHYENFIITGDMRYTEPLLKDFNREWLELAPV